MENKETKIICKAYRQFYNVEPNFSKENFDHSNIENIGKMIEEGMQTPYCTFMNESGDGKSPKITEASRKRLAKSLINRS